MGRLNDTTKKTTVVRLRYYMAQHRKAWDDFVQPLMYSFNTQVHRSTNCIPFPLVLSCEPPRATTPVGPAALPNDVTQPQTTPSFLPHILRRLSTVRTHADKSLTAAQRRYKYYFYYAVRPPIVIAAGQELVEFRATKATHSTAERMVKAPRTKLLPRWTGPFRFLAANEDTIKILEDSMDNTISIDRVSVAPDAVKGGTTDAEGHATTRHVGGNHDTAPVAQDAVKGCTNDAGVLHTRH